MAGNSAQTAKRRRGPGRPFVKGVSGNPSGRPKGYAAFRDGMRELTPEAIEALRQDLLNPDRRTAAARAVLEYAWGKAPSAPDDLESQRRQQVLPEGLTLHEVRQLARLSDEEVKRE
mgnify:CR=1 FL=1